MEEEIIKKDPQDPIEKRRLLNEWMDLLRNDYNNEKLKYDKFIEEKMGVQRRYEKRILPVNKNIQKLEKEMRSIKDRMDMIDKEIDKIGN